MIVAGENHLPISCLQSQKSMVNSVLQNLDVLGFTNL